MYTCACVCACWVNCLGLLILRTCQIYMLVASEANFQVPTEFHVCVFVFLSNLWTNIEKCGATRESVRKRLKLEADGLFAKHFNSTNLVFRCSGRLSTGSETFWSTYFRFCIKNFHI